MNAMDDTPIEPDASEVSAEVRTFLVVVDRSEEMKAALRYACRRVKHTGGTIALFHAVPQTEFHHFKTIGELMDHEARTEAERRLQEVAGDVHRQTGKFPDLHFRQGDALVELTAVIAENPAISVLVLGAGTGGEGPGPIVSALSGKLAGKINIPVTIVPGDLTLERIDAIS
jgi:nucleotide-binding universal stress UspA family protein